MNRDRVILNEVKNLIAWFGIQRFFALFRMTLLLYNIYPGHKAAFIA